MTVVLAAALTSFFICFLVIPSVIRVAQIKRIFDAPGERKKHSSAIPTLGGLGIFAGLIVSVTFWSTQGQIIELQYIITSLCIIFFLGLKDDIVDLVAYKKLIAQIVAAFILVHYAGIRVETLYGLFKIDGIPMWASYALSMLAIVGITNSFNLIDGVDTLAASMGIIAAAVFGTWFFFMGQLQYTILCASLVGALLAFLYYNRPPAKIFMGDTGSLIVGLISAIVAVKFVEVARNLPIDHPYKIRSAPIFILAVLCIPVVDTVRVFVVRLLQGRSPMSPDRNHLHHKLVDAGFSHVTTTAILSAICIALTALTFLMSGRIPEIMLLLIPATVILAVAIICKLKASLTARAPTANNALTPE